MWNRRSTAGIIGALLCLTILAGTADARWRWGRQTDKVSNMNVTATLTADSAATRALTVSGDLAITGDQSVDSLAARAITASGDVTLSGGVLAVTDSAWIDSLTAVEVTLTRLAVTDSANVDTLVSAEATLTNASIDSISNFPKFAKSGLAVATTAIDTLLQTGVALATHGLIVTPVEAMGDFSVTVGTDSAFVTSDSASYSYYFWWFRH